MTNKTEIMFVVLLAILLALATLFAVSHVSALPLSQGDPTPTPTVTPIMPDLVIDSEIAYGDTLIVTVVSCVTVLFLLAFLYQLITTQADRKP